MFVGVWAGERDLKIIVTLWFQSDMLLWKLQNRQTNCRTWQCILQNTVQSSSCCIHYLLRRNYNEKFYGDPVLQYPLPTFIKKRGYLWFKSTLPWLPWLWYKFNYCDIDRFLKIPFDAFQVSTIALSEMKRILKIQEVCASEKNMNLTFLC